MREPKFRFNPETLKYEKVERNLSRVFLLLFGNAILVLLIAGGTLYYFSNNYDTPKEKALREENTQLLEKYNALNKQLVQIEDVLDEIQVRDDNIYRVIFDTDPIPESVRKAGFGGTNKYEGLESFTDADIVVNTAKKIDVISKQAYIQAKSYEEVLSMAITKEKELSSIPAIMPISNKELSFISSGYGYRIHPIYKVRKFHAGMDFVASKGTNVYATGDGKVIAIKSPRTGHGKHIVINHGFGYETLYAHLSGYNVKVGDTVKRGQVIGFVGSTGTSTAPHLHYEVHKDGKTVNPKNYYFKDLTPEAFEELAAKSAHIGVSFD